MKKWTKCVICFAAMLCAALCLTYETRAEGFSSVKASTTAFSEGAVTAAQAAMPEEWKKVTEEAPITAEKFNAMTLPELIANALSMVGENFTAPLKLFARLCGVIILTAAVKGLAGQSEAMDVLDIVAGLTVFLLCSTQLLSLVEVVQAAVEDCRVYLAAFVPIFAAALVSCGQTGVSIVYSGLFFGVTSLTANVLCNVVLPLSRVFLALNATSLVDSAVDLSKLAQTLIKWIKWMFTLLATVFATVLGLQSALAQGADSAALKAGKFLIGSSVPVVGRAVSDAMGSVLAGMKLLKGTVGFAAVAMVGASFLPVILQCAGYHAAFTLGAMVAGATDSRHSEKLLNSLAQCVGLYITLSLIFALMIISATMLMVLLGTNG